MEVLANRFYKAVVNFSTYNHEDTAVEAIVKLSHHEDDFRIVSCEYARRYNGFHMEFDEVEVKEEIGISYNLSDYNNVPIIADGKLGVIISKNAYRVTVKMDGESEEKTLYDWEYTIPDEYFLAERVVINRGEAKYVTGICYGINSENGKLMLRDLSREDIDVSYVTVSDIDIVTPITTNSVVMLKSYDALLGEFGPERMSQMLHGSTLSHCRMFVTRNEGNMIFAENADGKFYIDSSLVMNIRSYMAYHESLYKFGDVISYQGNKGRAIVRNGNLILALMDRELGTHIPYNFGFDCDPDKFIWVAAENLVLLERDPSYHIGKPSLSSTFTNAIKSFVNNNHKFEVGETITIRSYEDMITEFGVNDNNEPKTKCRFTSAMHHLCGRTATIRSIDEAGRITLDNWSDPDNTNFVFSTEFVVGGDTVTKIDRISLQKAIGNVVIGNSEMGIEQIPFTTLSYGISYRGDLFRFINCKDKVFYEVEDQIAELSSRKFKSMDIACIIKADSSGRIALGNYSINVIWENKLIVSEKDIELLTGIKVTD